MPLGATRAQQNAVVRAIRSFERTYEPEVMVTGRAALDLDIQQFVLARVPSAIAFVMVMTYVVLFALLRSVFLPLKAVVMNLLSITCSFGALVWIFQEGHLSRLLRFTPAPIDPSLPVVLFCTVFGLSMDYEVFLLTRMREVYLRTRDNTHAVAEGLERSGRIVTSAAAIMVVVFAAFASAEVVLIKAVGLGMALAIAIDATIVRVLIVPATMRLFGDINWWAPGRMALPPPPPTGNHQPA
jgi:RND superfamily putative drug exporter